MQKLHDLEMASLYIKTPGLVTQKAIADLAEGKDCSPPFQKETLAS